jgi:hypothetical protein
VKKKEVYLVVGMIPSLTNGLVTLPTAAKKSSFFDVQVEIKTSIHIDSLFHIAESNHVV